MPLQIEVSRQEIADFWPRNRIRTPRDVPGLLLGNSRKQLR
ncbi:MAG: hypothetical protein ACP5KN_08420 [Armatimonadota bacterium]